MVTESVIWDWVLLSGLATSMKLHTEFKLESEPTPISSPLFILIDLCMVRWKKY